MTTKDGEFTVALTYQGNIYALDSHWFASQTVEMFTFLAGFVSEFPIGVIFQSQTEETEEPEVFYGDEAKTLMLMLYTISDKQLRNVEEVIVEIQEDIECQQGSFFEGQNEALAAKSNGQLPKWLTAIKE